MSAAILRLENLTDDESAVLRELVQLRAQVANLNEALSLERALRRGAYAELVSLRLLRKEVIDAAIAAGFGQAPA